MARSFLCDAGDILFGAEDKSFGDAVQRCMREAFMLAVTALNCMRAPISCVICNLNRMHAVQRCMHGDQFANAGAAGWVDAVRMASFAALDAIVALLRASLEAFALIAAKLDCMTRPRICMIRWGGQADEFLDVAERQAHGGEGLVQLGDGWRAGKVRHETDTG